MPTKKLTPQGTVEVPLPRNISDMERFAPYPDKLPSKEYEQQLALLQVELLKMQRWVKETGQRVLILFEGRDAAGKGGAIRRFTENINPRGARVVALPAPSDVERTQWYFQRYVAHLPSAGEIVFFDRSWYNRAGVEIVMGFCTEAERADFFGHVPTFEASLVNSGIHLFKLWFTVSKDEQARRFEGRRQDPLRQWKLSPMDEAAIARFADYGAARDAMLANTHLPATPWTVVNSNDKKRARLESIRHVLHSLPYANKAGHISGPPDPRVVQSAAAVVTGTPRAQPARRKTATSGK